MTIGNIFDRASKNTLAYILNTKNWPDPSTTKPLCVA